MLMCTATKVEHSDSIALRAQLGVTETGRWPEVARTLGRLLDCPVTWPVP